MCLHCSCSCIMPLFTNINSLYSDTKEIIFFMHISADVFEIFIRDDLIDMLKKCLSKKIYIHSVINERV